MLDASINSSINVKSDVTSSEIDSEVVCTLSPLHEAAKSGDAQKVLELLELAEAAQSQNTAAVSQNEATCTFTFEGTISKEEKLKLAQAVEREKRAAAAERRIAKAAAAAGCDAQGSSTTLGSTTSQSKSGVAGDISCSCCDTLLAGKVLFHRYNY
ncbi:hypothetical protein PTKIN_Ptkin12aG0196800 [Pterospermum kingtungense]